jgi:hypothetical protein
VIAFSYGGGVQSVAICVLVKEGVLPKPDLVGIADTSREMPSTWKYLDEVVRPYLAPMGLEVEVVPHTLARKDLYDGSGLTLMPAFTRTEDGVSLFGDTLYAEGRQAAFCSGEWKRDVMERWLRSKGVKECDQWIGYSLDEKRRMSKPHRPWCRPAYPLIEKGVTREMCLSIIKAAGLPRPSKSRCFMCAHQDAEEWQQVKDDYPEEFAAAVAIEKAINETDPDKTGELFLWSGRVPLPMADFSEGEGPAPPARPCDGEGCWT